MKGLNTQPPQGGCVGGEAKNSLQGLERHLQVVVALLLRQLGELHQTRVLPLVVISDLKQDGRCMGQSPSQTPAAALQSAVGREGEADGRPKSLLGVVVTPL